MIETLEITNFKSVKMLTLPCKRFNIFIGEPNTGKSNILEALGLMSFVATRAYAPNTGLDGFVRHERMSNLFYDEEVGDSLSVRCDGLELELVYREGRYQGKYRASGKTLARVSGDNRTITDVDYKNAAAILPIKFYRSPTIDGFGESPCDFLLPPHGDNLPSLLLQNRELRNTVNLPFKPLGLRLGLRPHENKIELVKSFDDIIISYPYSLVSETLQRLTFYTAAIDTNRNTALVFEEPETHSFPYQTHFLAEVIERDENNNQYFITTHNPYFLLPLLSKTRREEIAVNVVYSDDYQTKVKELSQEDLAALLEVDIFANLDWVLDP